MLSIIITTIQSYDTFIKLHIGERKIADCPSKILNNIVTSTLWSDALNRNKGVILPFNQLYSSS